MTNPIRPTSQEAIQLAKTLLRDARLAALAVVDESHHPMVTRIGFSALDDLAPISLISDLSSHTSALRKNPACSLLIGEAGPRGDPLNQARITLKARARFVTQRSAEHMELAAHYLRDHPKAKLYINFADFSFVRFDLIEAALNGGFGKAYVLQPNDLFGPV